MGSTISVLGTAATQVPLLVSTLTPLLENAAVRQVIYLGQDQAATEAVAILLEDAMSTEAFVSSAPQVALHGSPAALEQLLLSEARGRRLAAVRCLPEPPMRAVEMLQQWLLLGVHDTGVLDEEDVANAHVIMCGGTQRPELKIMGQRCFICPGPLSEGHTGELELLSDGNLEVRLKRLDGAVVAREVLQTGTAVGR